MKEIWKMLLIALLKKAVETIIEEFDKKKTEEINRLNVSYTEVEASNRDNKGRFTKKTELK